MKLSKIFDGLVAISLSLMVLMVFVNACLRYLFNIAFNETEELARFLFIWVIFLGGIEAYRKDAYVRITLLSDACGEKTKKFLNTLAKLVEIGIILFLFWGGILYTMQASTYTTPGTNLNFGLIAVSLPVMAGAMLVVEVLEAVRKTGKKE